jgi:hypothetical protein
VVPLITVPNYKLLPMCLKAISMAIDKIQKDKAVGRDDIEYDMLLIVGNVLKDAGVNEPTLADLKLIAPKSAYLLEGKVIK